MLVRTFLAACVLLTACTAASTPPATSAPPITADSATAATASAPAPSATTTAPSAPDGGKCLHVVFCKQGLKFDNAKCACLCPDGSTPPCGGDGGS